MAERRRRSNRRRKTGQRKYKLLIVVILIFGGILLTSRMYQIWVIHQDMKRTVEEREALEQENQALQTAHDKLLDPEEIANEARQQSGPAKPGEIPYRR